MAVSPLNQQQQVADQRETSRPRQPSQDTVPYDPDEAAWSTWQAWCPLASHGILSIQQGVGEATGQRGHANQGRWFGGYLDGPGVKWFVLPSPSAGQSIKPLCKSFSWRKLKVSDEVPNSVLWKQ